MINQKFQAEQIKELVGKIRVEIKPDLSEKTETYLNKIEELANNSQSENSEENKKIFTELGIETEPQKQKVVKEIQRLAEIKNIAIQFTNDKDKIPLEIENNTITLLLNQTDNQGNFNPNLIFLNFVEELTHYETNSSEKLLPWWKELENERIWLKDNLSADYQKDFNDLLQPSTFPNEKLAINLVHVVNDLAGKETNLNKDFSVGSQIVDKAWKIVKDKALELGVRAIVHYHNDNTYTIIINYALDNSNSQELENLITTTPLKLEVERLKQEKNQLPTSENFEKLSKQNQLLKNYLQDLTDAEKYREILAKVEQIK